MKKSAAIVVGLGFGDEGKGLTTDYLCSIKKNPLVIRFNGGQQAGHTVVEETGRRHVFSNFGAGTLRGVPTYWSKFCTLSPGALLNEFRALEEKGTKPVLYLDRQCYVTTHYDVLCNRLMELSRGNARHGSCGMGFGVTIERNEVAGVSFLVGDLLDTKKVTSKLIEIRTYYSNKLSALKEVNFDELDHEAEDKKFVQYLGQLNRLIAQRQLFICNEEEIISEASEFDSFIFEGAQGIMLDMDFGHFPHVTRSNTCSKNALQLIQSNYPEMIPETELYYISRLYQTRHGDGPMTNQDLIPELQNTEQETNVYNEHQGIFRKSALDLDQLLYALKSDATYSEGLRKHMVFTCADQLVGGMLNYTYNGNILSSNVGKLTEMFDTDMVSVLVSYGPKAEDVRIMSKELKV
jgi:adenylosuccinate synthase